MNPNAPLTTDPLPRGPDHTIDRALSALRDVAPRPGLNGRILASLEHRATTPGGPSFRAAKGWGIVCGSKRENARGVAHIALWTATATSAAVLAIASFFLLHHHTVPEFAQTPQSSAGIASPGLAAGFSPLNTSTQRTGALAPARTTPTVSSRPERVARSGETCISNHPECSNHADDASSPTPTDAQALADLHASSHPAPPLPLTPQEKLFLRMLRYGHATQLAELNPVVRAQHDDAEAAEFKAFFPDPPPLQQPLGDTE